MKPRFRAEWEVSSEELCILASWFLSPMSKNSVLEELRVRRLAVIQEEMCWTASWRWEMLQCYHQISLQAKIQHFSGEDTDKNTAQNAFQRTLITKQDVIPEKIGRYQNAIDVEPWLGLLLSMNRKSQAAYHSLWLSVLLNHRFTPDKAKNGFPNWQQRGHIVLPPGDIFFKSYCCDFYMFF